MNPTSCDLNKQINICGKDEKGRFVKGHKHSPETLEKIRASKTGCKGHPCWMKGLTKKTDERIAKMAANKTGKKTGPRPDRKGIRVSISTEFKKGQHTSIATEFKKGMFAKEKHSAWKGGVSTEYEKIKIGPEYKAWRMAVYQRDHFHCQICKKHCSEKDIAAHHINSFAAYPHLRFTIDNGITLCRSCHIKVHKDKETGQCRPSAS